MEQITSLYVVLEKKKHKVVVQLCSPSNSIFRAHFPNNPILPGFCHIEILSNIFNDNVTKIRSLKLQQKVLPQDTITYEINVLENQKKIKIFKFNEPIGQLQYEC